MTYRFSLAAALAACLLSRAAHGGDKLSSSRISPTGARPVRRERDGACQHDRFDAPPNGVITGRAKGEKDRGLWRVKGEQLCIAWSKWNDGKTSCAALSGDNGSYRGGGLPSAKSEPNSNCLRGRKICRKTC